MSERPRIELHIEEPARRGLHPCVEYGHRWAWAYLARGGTAQCCRRCGAGRR